MVSIPPPGGRGVLPEISLKLSNTAPSSGVPRLLPVDHARSPRTDLRGAFLADLGPQSAHRRIFKAANSAAQVVGRLQPEPHLGGWCCKSAFQPHGDVRRDRRLTVDDFRQRLAADAKR